MKHPAKQSVRTCIGCRAQASRDSLLRIVWDADRSAVAIDPARVLPGRGASLHPDRACLDLALKRRAIGRALRIVDVDAAQVLAAWQDMPPRLGAAPQKA